MKTSETDWLSTLSPRYVIISYLTHGDGVGGRGGEGGKLDAGCAGSVNHIKKLIFPVLSSVL